MTSDVNELNLVSVTRELLEAAFGARLDQLYAASKPSVDEEGPYDLTLRGQSEIDLVIRGEVEQEESVFSARHLLAT
jgi:hypothetical protein